MDTYTKDHLLARLPGAHQNGRVNCIGFRCILCGADKAAALIIDDTVRYSCAGCYQSRKLAEALAHILEGDPKEGDPCSTSGSSASANSSPNGSSNSEENLSSESYAREAADAAEELEAGADSPPPREPGADEEEDEFQADELRWKAKLWATGKGFLEDSVHLRQLSGKRLAARLGELLQALIVSDVEYTPPGHLSAEEIQHQVEVTVQALLLDAGRSVGPDEFQERHAIDAYEGWKILSREPLVYAVEKFLRVGHTVSFSGLMGSGKTTLLMWLARCLALGLPFLGRATVQGRVLAIVSSKEYDNWLEAIGFWELKGLIFIQPSIHFHWNDPKKAARHLQNEMDENGCIYFILDTLFDFFGISPNNSGDQNRNIMNEQAPLLTAVRDRRFAGAVSGHQPKSEAKNPDPRDPEEAFAGNTGWMAQHRMRASLRRKSHGYNALITGRGGYGDEGFLKEQLVKFDERTREVAIGGLFSEHLGAAALPDVLEALQQTGEWMSRADLEKQLGKGKSFVLAGLKHGMKQVPPVIEKTGTNRSTAYRRIEPEQD